MKSLIIYCSSYKGNTEKIAEVFAKITKAELINLKNCKDIKIEEYDLIGFGAGVYKESMSPQLLSYVDKLNLKNKKVFVFSTSGVGLTFYNKKLIKLLTSKGAICKGSFACKGSFVSKDFSNNKIFEIMSKFAKGHPNYKDFERAENFIKTVML
ncbi:flavodoxin domain-containing protein [Clostridium tunisiense]|uniref:flavodoxin domain-containing protein n=1 Tax=Clostridium tunisiense TaxID=219748 RepID=UPI0002EA2139|nr:flavodoxin domain-containing protein [Clostridium tunisiense]